MTESQPGPTGAKHLVVAGVFSIAAWSVLAWRSHQPGPPLAWMLAVVALAWLALGWALVKISSPGTKAMLGFALGFRLIALCATPVMEDDHWRFLWDGYRFAATGNPYAEAPQERFVDESIPAEFRAVLDDINYPDVPTIYGPLAQWAFRLSHAIAPAELWPWKLILLVAECALFALLWPLLKARGRLLLAWCPLAIFETGFNAHPDALAIALIVAAWRLGDLKLPLAAGVAAGLAIAAKVFAAPLVPFVLWRQGWRAWVLAGAAGSGLYAPFWLQGSTADLAGLRAMAGEWEFNSSLYALVATAIPPSAARAVCGGAFAVIWLALLVRWAKKTPPVRPPGEWVYGSFLLLSATANPWYVLWLLPFVAFRFSAAGIAALAVVSLTYITGLNLGADTPGYFAHPWWLRPVEFGVIGVAALFDARGHRAAHFFFLGKGKRWFT